MSLMHVSEVGVEQGVLGFGCTSREYQTPIRRYRLLWRSPSTPLTGATPHNCAVEN